MTRIERIKLVLKYFRAVANVFVCAWLSGIILKIKPSANGRITNIVGYKFAKSMKDIAYVFKKAEMNEEYEECKQLYKDLLRACK